MSSDTTDNTFDSIAYRRTLGGFGTGVALAAAYDARGRAHGMVINSLTSVSLDPPIVLWCLAGSSGAYDVYTQCGAFSLNILGTDFEDHIARFSARGDRIIPEEFVDRLETGAPILKGAVVNLDCELRCRQTMGDHEVIFGNVVAYRSAPDVDALGFFRGKYVTLASEDRNNK